MTTNSAPQVSEHESLEVRGVTDQELSGHVMPELDAGLFLGPTALADQAGDDLGHRKPVETVRPVCYGHDVIGPAASTADLQTPAEDFRVSAASRQHDGASRRQLPYSNMPWAM